MNNAQIQTQAFKTDLDFDSRWKNLTRQASAKLNAGDVYAAGLAYDQAYHEARIIFADAWNGNIHIECHAPPILVVSATNAADQRRARGHEKAAENQLISAVRIFTEALMSNSAPQGLKRCCAEHLPRLLTELNQNHEDTQSIIEDAKSAALAHWKTCAH